jgi:hypothetical protein
MMFEKRVLREYMDLSEESNRKQHNQDLRKWYSSENINFIKYSRMRLEGHVAGMGL